MQFASSVILSAAVRAPGLFGANRVLTIQDWPEARAEPQVLLAMEKSAAFAPSREMPVIFIAELPPLLIVSICSSLVVPTGTMPKLEVAGEIRTSVLHADKLAMSGLKNPPLEATTSREPAKAAVMPEGA